MPDEMGNDMRFFGKLFANKNPNKVSASPYFPDVSVRTKLVPLETSVFTAAMEASKSIEEGWAERTGQSEMPFVSSWAIRVEELGFCLHLVCRIAFTVGYECQPKMAPPRRPKVAPPGIMNWLLAILGSP